MEREQIASKQTEKETSLASQDNVQPTGYSTFGAQEELQQNK